LLKNLKTQYINFLARSILTDDKKIEASLKTGEQDTERITPKLPRSKGIK